jgi:hypothetical protein
VWWYTPVIQAIQEVEAGGSLSLRPSLGKVSKILSEKQINKQKPKGLELRHSSSDRVLAQQVQIPRFNPQDHVPPRKNEL